MVPDTKFTDALAILSDNPGMTFQRAAELADYKGPMEDPNRDRSANFDWGADLPYDPNIYQLAWHSRLIASFNRLTLTLATATVFRLSPELSLTLNSWDLRHRRHP